MVGNGEIASSVEIRPDRYGGKGLFAKQDIHRGDVALIEAPLFMCPTNVLATCQRFGTLTNAELRQLETLQSPIDLLGPTDVESCRLLSNSRETVKAFRWFLALMRCNAHGVSVARRHEPQPSESDDAVESSGSFWAIFLLGCRANHSCHPNASYRCLPGPYLCYIALRDIRKGEEVLLSYTDCLYASTPFRRQRLLNQKLFLCECPRCSQTEDPARRVFCPLCRRQGNEGQEHPYKAAGYCQYMESDTWLCPRCKLTFNDSVVPVVVEKTLEEIFSRLNQNFAQPSSQDWLNFLGYLWKTCKDVLGEMHWINAGCRYLFARYYAALWYGGERSHATVASASRHTQGFSDYLSVACPEAIDTDLLPWASAMMRLTLASNNSAIFQQLATKYLRPLVYLYGYWDSSVKAYSAALNYLQPQLKGPSNCEPPHSMFSNGLSHAITLKDFHRQSLFPATALPKECSHLKGRQLPTAHLLAQRNTSDDILPVVDLRRWTVRPWRHHTLRKPSAKRAKDRGDVRVINANAAGFARSPFAPQTDNKAKEDIQRIVEVESRKILAALLARADQNEGHGITELCAGLPSQEALADDVQRKLRQRVQTALKEQQIMALHSDDNLTVECTPRAGDAWRRVASAGGRMDSEIFPTAAETGKFQRERPKKTKAKRQSASAKRQPRMSTRYAGAGESGHADSDFQLPRFGEPSRHASRKARHWKTHHVRHLTPTQDQNARVPRSRPEIPGSRFHLTNERSIEVTTTTAHHAPFATTNAQPIYKTVPAQAEHVRPDYRNLRRTDPTHGNLIYAPAIYSTSAIPSSARNPKRQGILGTMEFPISNLLPTDVMHSSEVPRNHHFGTWVSEPPCGSVGLTRAAYGVKDDRSRPAVCLNLPQIPPVQRSTLPQGVYLSARSGHGVPTNNVHKYQATGLISQSNALPFLSRQGQLNDPTGKGADEAKPGDADIQKSLKQRRARSRANRPRSTSEQASGHIVRRGRSRSMRTKHRRHRRSHRCKRLDASSRQSRWSKAMLPRSGSRQPKPSGSRKKDTVKPK